MAYITDEMRFYFNDSVKRRVAGAVVLLVLIPNSFLKNTFICESECIGIIKENSLSQ